MRDLGSDHMEGLGHGPGAWDWGTGRGRGTGAWDWGMGLGCEFPRRQRYAVNPLSESAIHEVQMVGRTKLPWLNYHPTEFTSSFAGDLTRTPRPTHPTI
jgi:hypothetical protein